MDLYISGSKNVSLCVSFKNRSITVHPHILFEIISYLKQSNLRILPLVLLILLETFYLVGCCWPIFYSILLFFSGILRYFVAENSLLHRIFVYFFFFVKVTAVGKCQTTGSGILKILVVIPYVQMVLVHAECV